MAALGAAAVLGGTLSLSPTLDGWREEPALEPSPRRPIVPAKAAAVAETRGWSGVGVESLVTVTAADSGVDAADGTVATGAVFPGVVPPGTICGDADRLLLGTAASLSPALSELSPLDRLLLGNAASLSPAFSPFVPIPPDRAARDLFGAADDTLSGRDATGVLDRQDSAFTQSLFVSATGGGGRGGGEGKEKEEEEPCAGAAGGIPADEFARWRGGTADAGAAATAAAAAAFASFSEERGMSFAMRAACSATRGVDGSLERSSPPGRGWATDNCREGREDFGGSDEDEGGASCATSLRRGTVADASRPRPAGMPASLAGSPVSTTSIPRDTTLPDIALSFVNPSSSDGAPATATATAGGPVVTSYFVPERGGALVTASLPSRRDDDDDLEDGDRLALPRFLLAIPPGLVEGGAGAAVAGAGGNADASGGAGTVGGEGLLEEGTPSAAAGASGRGAAGLPAVLIEYGAIIGFCFGFVNGTSGTAEGPPSPPGDPVPAAPAAAAVTATGILGAGSQEVARLRSPWPFSALAIFSTE